MKKRNRIILFSVMLLLGVLLASCQNSGGPNATPTPIPSLKPTPDPSDTSNLFQSEQYHLSYRLPTGWTFSSQAEGVVSMCQDTQKLQGFASNFMITASARDPELSNITAESFQTSMRSVIKDYQVTEFTSTQNEQGELKMNLTGTCTSNGQALVNKLTTFNKGDYCFSLSFTCSAQGWDTARQDYDYLMSSLGD